ncbi:hypothetical protein [Halalkalibacter krulwichiae]|uniref:Membrane protein YszA n=1 Tax=Halalkalibacter krulwichiae TaxID=199441 RepID=A0A1X9MHL1_9BACI|nr:hypothetical protein [Halalkalibacter krulwichiae]ARK31613.1 hypothetical protein BkAM31D_18165 [Halalkalibacter krulwichiae]
MKRRFGRFHHHFHPKRPGIWFQIKAICIQIFLPLICFQLLRTLLLPTTFDIVLLTLMIAFYLSLKLRII